MTKDRRLGRGLAALLGTPLEGDLAPGGLGHAELNATGHLPNSAAAPSSPSVLSATAGTPSSSPAHGSQVVNRQSVTGAVPLATTGRPSGTATLELSVYEIDNNPFQPRRKFNEEEIAALAASIREHQQLQPILVRRVDGRYQLISGERRLRAAIHAGLKTIRAEVRQADDRLVAELAIVENLQRKDLDAIEKALSFRRYIDEHKCTQEDLAKRLKIDRSTIANLMRLLELPAEIQQWVQSEQVTAGHARALLPLGDETQQLVFAQQIREEGWSVRETERRVSEQLKSEDDAQLANVQYEKPNRKRTSPQLAALEQQIRLTLGTKVEIRQTTTGRGKISITFSSHEEFERLCAQLCPNSDRQRAA
ncbi:MAG: ParB/RepB/Spo0J family partition protein [Pirellulaceae bacterium]|nr:ParB/RepB/Spo0J family partition protein [Pirellulaceae bacterium]